MRRASLTVVGTYALAWFLLNVFRAALPILLPEIRRLYGVGFADAGFIFALLFAGLALMQFPSGLLADAVGDRQVVFGSLLASSLCLSLFGFATSVPALLALAFSFGVAVGGFRSVAISSVSKVVDERERNGALGLMAVGNPVGNLLGPVTAAVGIAAFGVVGMPLALGAVGLLFSFCLGFVLFRSGTDDRIVAELSASDTEDRPYEEARRRAALLGEVVTSRAGVLIVLVSLSFSMTWQGMFTFLPSYLVEVRQLALDGSGVITGITFGVGIVANVGAGRLADYVGESVVLLGGFLLGAASLVALLVVGTLAPAVVALVGLGLGLGAITPPRDTFISRLSGPEDRGSVVGGVRTTYILLASGGTALAGLVIEYVGFDGVLLLFAGTLGVGALAATALLLTTSDRDGVLI